MHVTEETPGESTKKSKHVKSKRPVQIRKAKRGGNKYTTLISNLEDHIGEKTMAVDIFVRRTSYESSSPIYVH
jgi:hypothetical protein